MAAAVKALAIVLDGELPVARLDEIDLLGDFRARQRVRIEVSGKLCRHVGEIIRRLLRNTNEDESGEHAHMNRFQPQVRRTCVIPRRSTPDDPPARVVTPAVIRAHQLRTRPRRTAAAERARPDGGRCYEKRQWSRRPGAE